MNRGAVLLGEAAVAERPSAETVSMMLLPVHVIGGAIAIVSGFVALYALKGAKLHRTSGMIFVYAMLIMTISAAVMATLVAQKFNAMQGVLTLYLVTTAWLTVRRGAQEPHWVNACAMVVALMVGVYDLTLGFEALNRPRGTIDGVPAAMVFIFAGVALLAALGDARMMRAGGLQGPHRIARHLWRMCFAVFVASGSFFLGQIQVIPEPIRIVPVLAIPALLPLVLMLYWLARLLFTQRYPRRPNDSYEPAPVRGPA
jgi:uncharacterized membrane protein